MFMRNQWLNTSGDIVYNHELNPLADDASEKYISIDFAHNLWTLQVWDHGILKVKLQMTSGYAYFRHYMNRQTESE